MDRDPNSSLKAAAAVRARLLRWYRKHRRELPWRDTRDPYRVWVSEVMLQQTRVPTVLKYYERFLQRFPNVQALARAQQRSVLALWSGLGYYRRARAMHRAARQIAGDSGGIFPETAAKLRALPGVGRYTAAAIASIAFNQPCAVVDGNVDRVLQRLTGKPLAREEIWNCAQSFLSRRHPGDFNQAMMELGATVCLPGKPRCQDCPLMQWCATRGQLAAKKREVRHKREIAYQLRVRGKSVWLVQRAKNHSLMAGMWELPRRKSPSSGKPGTPPLMRLSHSITTTDYKVAIVPGCSSRQKRGRWVPLASIERVPLTGLARKVLRRANLVV